MEANGVRCVINSISFLKIYSFIIVLLPKIERFFLQGILISGRCDILKILKINPGGEGLIYLVSIKSYTVLQNMFLTSFVRQTLKYYILVEIESIFVSFPSKLIGHVD